MMTTRINASSGSPLELSIGFSRASRIGSILCVSGTAPMDEKGQSICIDDLYGQTKRCLEISAKAIADCGGSLEHVIRTRLYLTDISRWRDAAKAHGEFFVQIQPACTFIEVRGFIRPEWLVETEMDCVVE